MSHTMVRVGDELIEAIIAKRPDLAGLKVADLVRVALTAYALSLDEPPSTAERANYDDGVEAETFDYGGLDL